MSLKIDNYLITTPILDILEQVKIILHNGKLNTIKPSGSDIRVTCPSHKGGRELTADCQIYIGKDTEELHTGTYHCFACGEKGDFVKFIASCFDSSYEWAKNWLISKYGEEIEYGSVNFEDLPIIDIYNKSTIKILKEDVLKTLQPYHPYMTQRKLSTDVCKLFDVKYDPHTESICFPIRNSQGKLTGITRRSINTKFFMLPEDLEKEPYLLYYIKQNNIKTCIITEGQIDALTAWSYGFPAIATMGQLSEDQIKILANSGINCFIVMFDNDDAGRKMSFKFNKEMSTNHFLVNPIFPKGKKDINELTQDEFWDILKKEGIELKLNQNLNKLI